ncbi:PhnD/SsuA/transferrin family substrate-binding protein [Dokdonella sp.]|uniref:phosphate/phosphite/phosphonate ABC transporter substrate-binding protein n=1 Tax=Dokdonella sp. TaxID=2291710 RepID=UPI0025BCEFFA|nr:PhnD/SsuA/transferrin family substrate-binding protein [Dokdonella sp.]MBX3692599.1 PhnD/SsuA/transferrin family substrate-binding protein [Dokdonella sp.]
MNRHLLIARHAMRRLCVLAASLFAAGSSIAAEYRFSPEPIYAPDAARAIYKPLVEYLARETGEKFVLVTPPNYGVYWRNIATENITEFTLDEAHFADYRISRLGFVPLVRTAEPSSYTLASLEYEGQGLGALKDKRIATMPAPSLGYALLAQFYPNPIEQPRFMSTARSWRDGVQILFDGEVDAAIVPTWLKDTYPNLISIHTSRQYPGPALLASPSVPVEVRDRVRAALLKLADEPDLAELLLEIGVTRFVPATPEEYAGSQELLSGFHGYKSQ